MSRSARALWLTDVARCELREADLELPGPQEVLVEASFGAISRGTEALVAAGGVPRSEYERMRCPLQSGAFPFPVKYGYATVGTVRAGPRERIGETVFCLHPHQDRYVAPSAMAIAVPDCVPARRAVLAANMETALNGIWDADLLPGDKVAIVGGGLVGLLVAYLAAAIPGTEVTVVDIDPARGLIAAALGAGFVEPGDPSLSASSDSDVVIHASASSEGLRTAIGLAGFEARIVEMSWYGEAMATVPLGGAFHSQRLSIVGSQVGHVCAPRRARWPLSRRMATALSLLDDERLDSLFSGETRFAELPSTYADILDDAATLCHRIVYD